MNLRLRLTLFIVILVATTVLVTATFVVLVLATDARLRAALREMHAGLVWSLVVSVVCAGAVSWFYTGRALTPLRNIIARLSTISEQNLALRLDEGRGHNEIDKLAATFNGVLRRLQNAFTSQKNFIANASHEIKTPITIMASQIEVSLIKDHDKDHYKTVLRSMLEHLQGLNSLSSQLLLLAQTSADSPHLKLGILRIDDMLWEMTDEIMKVQPDAQVNIRFNFEPTPEALLIKGDEQLMKAALFNLIDNGCKYSDNQSVDVSLDLHADKRISLTFQNDGPGFTADQIQKIFAPFYRASTDKKIKGHGIGLSLVNRIMQLHKGSVEVKSVPGESTTFIVTLPVYGR